MPCSCWNSAPYDDEEYEAGRSLTRDRANILQEFLLAFDAHIKKGHTVSLLKRFGLEGARAHIAITALRAWMISGGPRSKKDLIGHHLKPKLESSIGLDDPTSDLSRAWQALILSDTDWYLRTTRRLYITPFEYEGAYETFDVPRNPVRIFACDGTFKRRESFLASFDLHVAKWGVITWMSQFGLSTDRAEAAITALREWMLSGEQEDPKRLNDPYQLPSIRHPDAVDPTGDLDIAWHALILANTRSYFDLTDRLYGSPMHHTETT